MDGDTARRIAALLVLAALALPSAPVRAEPVGRPRLRTADLDGSQIAAFQPGQRFRVLGDGFGAGGRAAVVFEQAEVTVQLAEVAIGEGGGLVAEASVPDGARRGPATVRASSGEAQTSAAVAIGSGESADAGEGLVALLPWAVVMLVASEVLAWSVWRPGRKSGEAGRRREEKKEETRRAPRRARKAQREREEEDEREPKKAERKPEEAAEPEGDAAPERRRSSAVRRLRDDIRFWTRDR